MAKISRVSLARKKELEKPDMILDFLLRAQLWVSQNKQLTAIAACSFMAVILIVTGGVYLSTSAEKKAFDRLAQIMPVNVDTSAPDANRMTAYQQLNEKHGGTFPGKIAGLEYADACYQSGDYEKAITAYQKALSDFKDKPFLKMVALKGLGYAYESSGAYDKALAAFKQIVDDPQSTMKTEALFNMGRLYERQGDVKNCREMYERILADNPDSFYAAIVKENSNIQKAGS